MGNDIPRKLLDYSRRWNVVLTGEEIETPRGIVAFGTRGMEAVALKVGRDGHDEANAGLALIHFGSRHAVRLLEHSGDAAILLERAMPGSPLVHLVRDGSDEQSTTILAEMMADIHRPQPPLKGFPQVEDWSRGFERHATTGNADIPADLVKHAHELFLELCETQTERRLLHGDLHHDNVLWDTRRGWLLIDPKGVIGEPAYEVGSVLRNPMDEPKLFADRSVTEKRVAVFERVLNADAKRMIGWGFAQAVLSAIWCIEDGESAESSLIAANALQQLL